MEQGLNESMVSWGIIGCAHIARKNIHAIARAQGCFLKAVASRSLEKAQDFISENCMASDAVVAYGNYDELLADKSIDAVYIPLPTTLHNIWVAKAAGK